MTAQLFFVEKPLTEKAAERARIEAQKKYKDELEQEKTIFGNLVLKSKAWHKLKNAVINAEETKLMYIKDNFKITIEKL